jgi:hypothetical protein
VFYATLSTESDVPCCFNANFASKNFNALH